MRNIRYPLPSHHTQIVMQSNFKSAPPPFIEEIQRDPRRLQEADHIVFMGYSLPPDDVDYRAFFAARRSRGSEQPKCSVVVGKDGEQLARSSELRDLSVEDIGDSERETLKWHRSCSERTVSASMGVASPTCFWMGRGLRILLSTDC